ncbi:FAD synthase [Metamycoplasma arthritidis]|nr:hypothetical protein [Metamycoplasma arthritidis]
MKVYNWDLLKQSPIIKEPLTICLGGFESLHLGHYELIKKAREINATNSENKLAILLLKNSINKGRIQEKKLFQLKTRLYTISALNFDYAFYIEVSEDLINLSAEKFIEKLKEINVKQIVCGPDFCFGHNRMGSIAMLKENFAVSVVEERKINKQKISSSLITELISDGNIIEANKLLLEKYAFITNINRFKFTYPQNLVKLKAGIYCVNVVIKDIEYHGVCLIKKSKPDDEQTLINKLYLFDLKIIPSKYEEIFIEFEKSIRYISSLASNDLFEKDLQAAQKFFENNK